MKPRAGQYFCRPRGRGWRVYQYDYVSPTATSAHPVAGEPLFFRREEAWQRVCQLNGWTFRPRGAAQA